MVVVKDFDPAKDSRTMEAMEESYEVGHSLTHFLDDPLARVGHSRFPYAGKCSLLKLEVILNTTIEKLGKAGEKMKDT